GLSERPGAEVARRVLRVALDLARELGGDRVGMLGAQGVFDGVGSPELVGGLARHRGALRRTRMRCTVVTCHRPPRLVLRPSALSTSTISGTERPRSESARMRRGRELSTRGGGAPRRESHFRCFSKLFGI